ncbi:deoxynucleotidyltransferase terminal-interacting protein 1 [Bradysia coprophila]|uniref:deoxynucleotidyltransferase terminal-interacting protein 1 n=1 Tax=Bradysia coprophila TaxID=38358 RepID=UPI00187D916F|nr:deoxynucleotidyltransferase terminal-interacting protein 1 [Bradysia coprophila]
MVIQRNWKTSTSSTDNVQQSSSESDSNSSCLTLSTTNSLNNNNKTTKIISSPQMAESVHKALKSRFTPGRSYTTQSNSDIAIRSMEMMRINIQDEFDREINAIVKKYIDTFFKPALKNVKENLGENSVSVDCLQKMSCSLLENAKIQYYSQSLAQTSIKIKSENVDIGGQSIQHQLLSMKPSEPVKRKLPEVHHQQRDNQENIAEKKVAVQPSMQLKPVGRTKQVYWNVSTLNTETIFVLDFKANRAFGFAPELHKDRLASKHPELIRYLPDNQDKDWMIQQKILSPANKNIRFLMLVYDEVIKISQSEEYRNKPQVKINDLEGFKVPDFILQKMKIFFTELSLRSQSFLVNSQFVTNVTSTSTGNTTQHQGINQIARPRTSSSLSSSHATLSALLSSSSEIVGVSGISNSCNDNNDAKE